jgi:hypothetical protein
MTNATLTKTDLTAYRTWEYDTYLTAANWERLDTNRKVGEVMLYDCLWDEEDGNRLDPQEVINDLDARGLGHLTPHTLTEHGQVFAYVKANQVADLLVAGYDLTDDYTTLWNRLNMCDGNYDDEVCLDDRLVWKHEQNQLEVIAENPWELVYETEEEFPDIFEGKDEDQKFDYAKEEIIQNALDWVEGDLGGKIKETHLYCKSNHWGIWRVQLFF